MPQLFQPEHIFFILQGVFVYYFSSLISIKSKCKHICLPLSIIDKFIKNLHISTKKINWYIRIEKTRIVHNLIKLIMHIFTLEKKFIILLFLMILRRYNLLSKKSIPYIIFLNKKCPSFFSRSIFLI